jgi:small subunit ribosomal protein S2
MVKAGMHLGHEARKWNPKMRFIYTEKNNIHIIDLIDTYSRFREILTDSTALGQTVLFVGTKASISIKAAVQCDSFMLMKSG